MDQVRNDGSLNQGVATEGVRSDQFLDMVLRYSWDWMD